MNVTPSPLSETDTQPSRIARNRPLLIAIAVLLALLVAVSATQLVMNLQANSARDKRAEAAEQLVQSQQSLITSLLTDYQDAAYDDPNVETIYQQQLIASEHILIALHVIAIQNSEVIELLAATP
jgi:predicted RND superfamily exporter protein